jgi:membrane dipeptidase
MPRLLTCVVLVLASPCRSTAPSSRPDGDPAGDAPQAANDESAAGSRPDGGADSTAGDTATGPPRDGAGQPLDAPGADSAEGRASPGTDPFAADLAIDLHSDVVLQVADHGRDFVRDDGEWTIARALRGGLDVQAFPLWIRPDGLDPAGALKRYARTFREMLDASDGVLALVRTSAEIRERCTGGRLGALLAIEGASPLGDDPANLDPYVEQGLRLLGLTWNDSNAFAEAAAEPRDPPGLTEPGRALVARANDAGVLLDLAHASTATFWDTYRVSRSPVLVSHAGLRALRPLARNIDDLQLLALARTGGLFGVVWHSSFLAELPEGQLTAPLDALVAHYEHARALGAGGALAIGTDLDGGIRTPEGLDSVAELPRLPAALSARGWTDDEVRGVLGGNFLRLLDAADAAVRGETPVRERPATTTCTGAPTAKDDRRLVDRAILPGPELAAGATILVAWERERDATAATLELWGAPGATVDVRSTAGASADDDSRLGSVVLDERGAGRLELPETVATSRRLGLAPHVTESSDEAPVEPVALRLDEVVVWIR